MYVQKNNPIKKKQKGGGTRKTCLPAAKIAGMSKKERQRLVSDWFQKEDWRQVNNPKKKCGEK